MFINFFYGIQLMKAIMMLLFVSMVLITACTSSSIDISLLNHCNINEDDLVAHSACVKEVAVNNKNAHYCDVLPIKSGDYWSNRYKLLCYEAAISAGDLNICKELSNTRSDDKPTKDYCYATIASETRNKDFCDEIKNNIKKSECISWLTTSQEDCTKISQMITRNSCYSNVALIKGDVTICSKIEQPEGLVVYNNEGIQVNPEHEKCVRKVAINLSDTSICEQLVDKKSCIDAINKKE